MCVQARTSVTLDWWIYHYLSAASSEVKSSALEERTGSPAMSCSNVCFFTAASGACVMRVLAFSLEASLNARLLSQDPLRNSASSPWSPSSWLCTQRHSDWDERQSMRSRLFFMRTTRLEGFRFGQYEVLWRHWRNMGVRMLSCIPGTPVGVILALGRADGRSFPKKLSSVSCRRYNPVLEAVI